MNADRRVVARSLAEKALREGRPLSWFEELYVKARTESAVVPWADMIPNPNVLPLFDSVPRSETGVPALKVGCGYGDDAEWLAQRGFAVTAFDISRTAIDECMRRFPTSAVRYVAADLFSAPAGWKRSFHVVWESYTLQVLPPSFRVEAVRIISDFVAPGGFLVFASRAREDHEPEGKMPWPLTQSEALAFCDHGLSVI